MWLPRMPDTCLLPAAAPHPAKKMSGTRPLWRLKVCPKTKERLNAIRIRLLRQPQLKTNTGLRRQTASCIDQPALHLFLNTFLEDKGTMFPMSKGGAVTSHLQCREHAVADGIPGGGSCGPSDSAVMLLFGLDGGLPVARKRAASADSRVLL